MTTINNTIELSIVMPCLNEAATLATCIQKAKSFLTEKGILGEIIIADNGSTDNSQSIAQNLGAKVVDVVQKGYGSALRGGIQAAQGKYIIMGDSDDSYDFYNLDAFVEKLRAGHDLVMGNRFKGGIKEGAMPFLHRYVGNPVLSFIGRLFFNIKVGDFHCGLRGFSKKAYQQMQLHTTGMEFASEMVVKASLKGMSITEVPTTLSPDGRDRPPHLNTWRDGWRHLRFLMVYSPKWLYLYPGMILIFLGLLLSIFLLCATQNIGGIRFDIQTLLYTALLIIIGFQFIAFYFLSIIYANTRGILPPRQAISRITQHFNLEKGLIFGGGCIIGGLLLFAIAFMNWQAVNFGPLDPSVAFRWSIPSCTLLVLGIQMVMYSFFWHILKVPTVVR